jgi:arylsulfatase A-like enzyme
MDLTATILAAAGAAPPAGRRLDGIDVLPILARTRPPLERTFFWRAQRTERPQRAVRKGNWKYLEDGAEAPILFLFDLEHDAGERRNLWYERPALAGELRGLLDRWQAEVTPAAGPGAGRR